MCSQTWTAKAPAKESSPRQCCVAALCVVLSLLRLRADPPTHVCPRKRTFEGLNKICNRKSLQAGIRCGMTRLEKRRVCSRRCQMREGSPRVRRMAGSRCIACRPENARQLLRRCPPVRGPAGPRRRAGTRARALRRPSPAQPGPSSAGCWCAPPTRSCRRCCRQARPRQHPAAPRR